VDQITEDLLAGSSIDPEDLLAGSSIDPEDLVAGAPSIDRVAGDLGERGGGSKPSSLDPGCSPVCTALDVRRAPDSVTASSF
jgi:hypothetical protein